ncbi:hypothetical protein F6R98_17360 [Candidatus Methylospira mobilis]|uniref:SsuA/THI5-like domain-containing protein n=1 Tax=Candidatus Methylospira mobilis TaxID=1808979 RepID=A0A5Q0BJX6_9GAMM|nr:hypothetical protein F6R98_17360 [Candidatus Methylospira mobilis]
MLVTGVVSQDDLRSFIVFNNPRTIFTCADFVHDNEGLQEHLMWKIFVNILFTAMLMTYQAISATNAEPPTKITFSYTFQQQSTLAHVAVAKGYFVEEGLDVQPLLHTYGKAVLQPVLDHKADFATAGETPVMFNLLKGEKIFVVANID